MATPAFANPGLSELMAPGNEQLQQINRNSANQQQMLGQIPSIFDRYEAGKAKEEESQRNNRPVTPWEKAAARLLAGHDPKAVAADTKASLAGQTPMNLGQGGMNAQPGMTPSMAQMPQVSSGPMSNGAFDAMGGQPQPQGRQGFPQPGISAPPGEDIFAGMNHRDWGEYVTALEKGRTAKIAADANKTQRDYLAEIAAKNAGNLSVAKERSSGAEQVQETKNTGNETTAKIKAKSATERINEKRDEFIQKHKDYQDYLQVLRDKQSSWERVTSGKVVTDPQLKLLQEKAKKLTDAYAKIGSANILDLTPKGEAESEKLKGEAADAWAAAEAYAHTHPQAIQQSQTQSQSSGQSGAKKHSVGDRVSIGGKNYIIDELSKDGKQAVKYHEAP